MRALVCASRRAYLSIILNSSLFFGYFRNLWAWPFQAIARFGKVFRIKAMDQLDSYDWMSAADRLTAAQAQKQRDQQHLVKSWCVELLVYGSTAF